MATTNKSNSATSAAKDKELEELKKQAAEDQKKIASLEEQIQKLITAMSAQMSATQGVSSTPTPSKLYSEATLVHLVDRAPGLRTHIELSNLTVDLTKFGEERTLTLQQFEECVGKYRRWFDAGIIAPGADAGDLARRYGLTVSTNYGITKETMQRLGHMSYDELESFYTKLGEGHRAFIIEYWKRKVLAKDPAFSDIHKIEVLNRVSDGAMEGTLLDIRTAKEREAIAAQRANKS